MSLDWRWEYDPDHEHVAGGVPAPMVAEVERLAGQLVDLAGTGVDVTDFGNGLRPGGLRRMDAAGGWFYFLVAPRDRLIVVVRIMPPFDALWPKSCGVTADTVAPAPIPAPSALRARDKAMVAARISRRSGGGGGCPPVPPAGSCWTVSPRRG